MQFYYSPLDKNCKDVRGGVREGQPFRLRLFCRDENGACKGNAYLSIGRDGEEKRRFLMTPLSDGWAISVTIRDAGLYFYNFYVENCGYVVYGDRKNGRLSEKDECDFLLTVSTSEYSTPEWIKGGVMYQIFPDRFCRENAGDGRGKFGMDSCCGERLEELAEGLCCRGNGGEEESEKCRDLTFASARVLREDWGGMPSYKPNEHGKVLNNDFFGGNLRGIESRLPYLADLGVRVVYLNPIFEAASNHRYDTADYMKIDPLLGTESDFCSLIEKGRELGIRFVLDGVFNHTGDDSRYFNKYGHYPTVGAYQSEKSPYASWYRFRQFPDRYDSWWGIDILPEVNEHSSDYQDFIFGDYRFDLANEQASDLPREEIARGEALSTALPCEGLLSEESRVAEVQSGDLQRCGGHGEERGVLKKWLSKGIGGYRLDVADELPDFFLKKLRKSVKEENEDAVIIGEVWEDASNKIAYSQRRAYLHGDELDSVMNYPFKDAIIAFVKDGNSAYLAETVANIVDHYPKDTLDCLMNILGTHDTARILTVLSGKTANNKDEMASDSAFLTQKERAEAIEKLKIAALLEYTLPGFPCVYYGDEIGIEGFGDPFCRRCFDWNGVDCDLREYYKRLGRLRKQYADVFAHGEYYETFEREGCYCFKRVGEKRSIYVFVNASNEEYVFSVKGGDDDGCNGCDVGDVGNGNGGVWRDAFSGEIVCESPYAKMTLAVKSCLVLVRRGKILDM